MKNWTLRKQLYIFLLFLVILPFICIILFLYNSFKNYSINLSMNHMKTEADFVTSQMSSLYETFDDITSSIYNHPITIGNKLDKDSLIKSIEDLSAEKKTIRTVYLDDFKNIHHFGTSYEQPEFFFTDSREKIISRNGKLTWLEPITTLNPSGRRVSLVPMGRSIRNEKYENVGILWIFVDSTILSSLISHSSAFSQSNNYFIYQNDIIFSYDNADMKFNSDEIIKTLLDKKKIGRKLSTVRINNLSSNKFILVEKESYDNHWHFVSITPIKTILTDFSGFFPLFLATVVIYLCFILFMQFILNKHIFSPINHLSKSIKRLSEGDFDTYVPTKDIQSGEIFNLISVYNYMVKRIKELMEAVKEKEREKNRYKAKMLNLQISPHFIYNTLNTIKMVAMINKQGKIAKLVDSLIVVLKSLTKTQESNTVADEIRLLESYVDIQKARYANFSMTIDAEEDTLHLRLPQYILQPIIENAIIHGFSEDIVDGKIIVKIWRADKLYITIEDTGKGFDEYNLPKSKSTLHSNIGLSVVKQIIQLECGENYGLTVLSNVSQVEGTLASYTLPIIEGEMND